MVLYLSLQPRLDFEHFLVVLLLALGRVFHSHSPSEAFDAEPDLLRQGCGGLLTHGFFQGQIFTDHQRILLLRVLARIFGGENLVVLFCRLDKISVLVLNLDITFDFSEIATNSFLIDLKDRLLKKKENDRKDYYSFEKTKK